MADPTLICDDSRWWAFSVLVVAVLLLFTLGVPIYMAIVLYNRRDVLGTKETKESLGVLYIIYRKECYWYESVNMLFKTMLWSALVFAEYGSQMQLATALVINVLQLLVMVHLKPFGGEFGDDMVRLEEEQEREKRPCTRDRLSKLTNRDPSSELSQRPRAHVYRAHELCRLCHVAPDPREQVLQLAWRQRRWFWG